MKNLYFLVAIVISVIMMIGCKPPLEVNPQILQEKIYEPTAVQYEGLAQSTVLYLDHSTCVIDAVQNSQVFRALRPNLGKYADTLVLIKGNSLEIISNIDKSPTSTTVANILTGINVDIPYANLGEAFDRISKSNSQSVIITDCEYFDANNNNQDGSPYLISVFIDWLKRGHTIYVITEPYEENGYGKKRFYFIFTNDNIEAPISHNMLAEIQPFLQDSICSVFKMTNSDIFVQFPKQNALDENLGIGNIVFGNGFEFIPIENSWDEIREYVMNLDKYGEPIEGGNAVPLIKNLFFSDGENYTIENIQIVATNITSQYLSKDCDAAANLKLDCKEITPNYIDISDGFMLDKNEFSNNKLNVMLTDKIITEGYLSNEFGGNLIRLDFVITEVELNPYDNTKFEWQSIWSPNQAICVLKSIDNALRDVEVTPTNSNRRIIHTIFVKSEALNN